MNALDVINQLAATNSRIEKEQILTNAFMTGHREFFLGAQLACDTLVSFGVKKVALITEPPDAGDPAPTFTFQDFLDLAGKLQHRKLTGHAARDAMADAAMRCDMDVWNGFYRRVLLKDLKIGCDESTINKVLGKLSKAEPEAEKLMVPVFSCQLAHDGEDPKHAKKLKSLKLLDIKLDGSRLLTVLDKDSGEVVQYTRNGKRNDNFTLIREKLIGVMDALPGSVVLDGEIVGKSFQELMTQMNRKTAVKTDDVKLALFDIIPLNDFHNGRCSRSQMDRNVALVYLVTSGLLAKYTGDSVWVVPKVAVDLDTEEGRASFVEFNRNALEAGYEGVMIKDPSAPYECKRTAAWLKVKPFIEVSLAVIEVVEGKPDTKYVGSMGALLCAGEDDGRMIEVSVGSGFSDADRMSIWKKRNEMIGMIVEIKADALTMERGSETWSLRFPRFKGFRGSVPGEKI